MMSKRKIFEKYVPLALALYILPFVTRLYIYTADMDAYAWFGLDTQLTDFFSHGKSCVFIVIAVYMFASLFWEWLQGRLVIRKSLMCCLIFGTAGCFIVSAIFAKDRRLALWGGYQRFEGLLVLLGYLIACIYAYVFVTKHSERCRLFAGLSIVAVICCFIGVLQITGHDPIFYPWVRQLILPKEMWDVTLDMRLKENTVYLTLANPNYAAMYLSAMIPLMFAFAKIQSGIKKILLYLLCVFLFVCVIYTYSRVGIFMIILEGIFGMWIGRKYIKKYWKQIVICLFGAVILFVSLDGITGFRFAERLRLSVQSFSQSRRNCNIDDLYIKKDGVYFSINEITVRVDAKYGFEAKEGLSFYQILHDKNIGENEIDITSFYDDVSGTIAYKGLEDIMAFVLDVDGEPMLILRVEDTVFRFAQDYEKGYMLYVGNGKYDDMQKIDCLNFHGMEHLASGRGYLWSRTIPLLKRYVFVGCGPDNYYLVFPQNDYLGKAQYCETPVTIVEKPHNTYLMIAVQNGVIPMLMLLGMYLIYLKEAMQAYSGKQSYTWEDWIGIGILLFSVAYLAGYMFNDSSVNISPIFWIMLGVGRRMVCVHGNMVKSCS